MHYKFVPQGVCPRLMEFDLSEDGKISNLVSRGGCAGNLQAISKLLEGRDAEEIISILAGNTCGPRFTSCADQLTIALRQALDGELQPA